MWFVILIFTVAFAQFVSIALAVRRRRQQTRAAATLAIGVVYNVPLGGGWFPGLFVATRVHQGDVVYQFQFLDSPSSGCIYVRQGSHQYFKFLRSRAN